MNDTITSVYTQALRWHAPYMLVRSIHDDRDICFNTDKRELVYAVYQCFKEQGIHTCYIKENILGLYACIPASDIPLTPPFKRFTYYFKKKFNHRLDLLEENFTTNKIFYSHLNKLREHIDNNPTIVKYLPFSEEILGIIGSYLQINCKNYYNLRDKYQELRYSIS